VRTLALDYGNLETIDARRTDPLSRIQKLVDEYGVTGIVIGLPIHMDGHEGPEAGEARAFGAAIESATSVSVHFLDERWTTVEADRTLETGGVRSRDRKGKRDRIAAALILQTFLERNAR
jgi:putative Holliday junction resolvase